MLGSPMAETESVTALLANSDISLLITCHGG